MQRPISGHLDGVSLHGGGLSWVGIVYEVILMGKKFRTFFKMPKD